MPHLGIDPRFPWPAMRLPPKGVAPLYSTLPPHLDYFEHSQAAIGHAYWVQSVQQDSGSHSVHHSR